MKISGKSKIFAVEFFEKNEPAKTVEFENEKGKFEFFFENINPPLNLIIFGAGYDAIPLADFAKNLGWRVSVVDHRGAFATYERFPNADEIHDLASRKFIGKFNDR